MSRYHLLRVFTAADGSGGNELGVFLDGSEVDPATRQAVAARLGYAEIVFVDDAATGELRIFTPALELPLAGHPLVGTSWLLRRVLGSVEVLRPPAGDVPTWAEDGITWIRANHEDGPDFKFVQLASPAEVDALGGAPDGHGAINAWAWADEEAGIVRSRLFFADAGIAEDEATGAAALRLANALGRPIEIHQGRGSELFARPAPGGRAEVGGRVALDAVRTL
jgi:predicted PhzF superfamily epimerase YddE/YHI9